MVEIAKQVLSSLLDEAEAETGIARLPVQKIMACAFTNTGAKIPKAAMKEAREALAVSSYEIEGIRYWERGRRV